MAFSSRLVRSFSTSSIQLSLAKMPIQIYGLDGRYASALYSVAVKKSNLEATEQEIKTVKAMFNDHKKFHDFVFDPTIKRREMKAALQEILKKLGCSEVAQNFFATVADNGRLGKIESIFKAFEKLMSAHRGEVACEIVTATPIDEATLKEATTALQGFMKSNQKLQILTKIDPSLLGGVVISIGDKYVNMSRLSVLTAAPNQCVFKYNPIGGVPGSITMNSALFRQIAITSRRSIHTSAPRQGFFKYNPVGGVPGSNLPFETKNRFALTLKMGAYIGLPMAYPFWCLKRILLQG